MATRCFLSTGKLIDAARRDAGKAYAIQNLVYASRDIGPCDTALAQPKTNILADIHRWKQRKMLKHHRHRTLVGWNTDHGLALDQQIALGGRLKPRDHPE